MSAMLKMVLNQIGLSEHDLKDGLAKFNTFLSAQKTQSDNIEKIFKAQTIIGSVLAQSLMLVRERDDDAPLLDALESKLMELDRLLRPEILADTLSLRSI